MFNIRGFSQNLQHLLLQLLDEIGHVVPAQLDPAHLDLPALEHTEIAVGYRDAASSLDGRNAT